MTIEGITCPRREPGDTEQDAVWRLLYRQQLPLVRRHACRLYLDGLERLAMPADRVPKLAELNRGITPRTGWRVVRTSVRYTDAAPWYRHFARREFLITDYMRSLDELVFTPEPDQFHDVFGHLPFFMDPSYVAIQGLFAPAFARASLVERENIKRLAWFSTEFGLIRERGELKVLGAGLISGGAELRNAVEGRVPVLPFSIQQVLGHEKAVWQHNPVLFEVPSLDFLYAELVSFLAA